jgi:hypothetical protein
MSIITTPQERLMRAAFALGQAQRDLERAEEKFKEALHAVELAESQPLPTVAEMRGIFKIEQR